MDNNNNSVDFPHMRNQENSDNYTRETDSSPPILKSWSRLYTLVIINLVLWLVVFYIIRRIFE